MFKKIREQLGGTLIDVTLNSAARAARYFPQAKPLLTNLSVERNLSYRTDSREKRHQLDVYRSTHYDEPRPVFIYIHGGGFRILSKETHWMMTAILAHQGFCVFSVNYGLAPEHRYPEGVHDVFAAVEWIADHAEEYGGDCSQIVVGGESAGANLTCGVALAHSVQLDDPAAQRIFERNLSIKAVAPACGFLEVGNTARFDTLQPDMPKLYRDRIGVISSLYADAEQSSQTLASPILWFESNREPDRPLPPMFVGVGDADPVFSDSIRLGDALKRRGVPSECIIYPGAIHAFQAFFWQQDARKFWREQQAFLRRYVADLNADFVW